MAYWLLKTEPGEYSFNDLVKDGRTVWSGIRNNTALMHMRNMKAGDLALIYHTGNQKAVVGTAEIARSHYPDPHSKDPKSVVVDVKPGKKLARPVPLSEIKSRKEFAGFELVRFSRLSVMPVSTTVWNAIVEQRI